MTISSEHSASIIDGKAAAATRREIVRTEVEAFVRETGATPGLAVVLVGADPASEIYVRTKGKQATACGFRSTEHRLPATASEAELLSLVERLNADDAVDGILVQLPLPVHIAVDAVLRAIDPRKDVDGFHPENVGALASGRPALVPCTPLGSLRLVQSVRADLAGLETVVLGRSSIVGRPAAQLFLLANTTVTIVHSQSRDVPALCRRADILIAAIGKPEFVRGDWIKPGAIVIDVGINRVADASGEKRIVGDVNFDEAARVAGAITPVPGGVGPMTVATLLENALRCARLRRGVADSPT